MSTLAPAEGTRNPDAVCVVIDCNEWIKLKWLGSPLGLTLISTLKRSGSLRLGIPEVLDGELNKHRAETAHRLMRRLDDIQREIRTVTGNSLAPGVINLTEVGIDVAIRQRLTSVAGQIVYPELTITQVRQALDRVNAETPPNGPKNQQMKDSLLWEACVSLSENYKIIFVTGDNGFYVDRQPNKGLARNLALEPSVIEGRLQVFPSLEEALRAFAPEALVDSGETQGIEIKEVLAAEVLQALKGSPVEAELQGETKLREVFAKYFRTELPHIFAVSFTAFFYVNPDAENQPRGEGVASGECTLDTRYGTVGAVNLNHITWRIRDASGNEFKTQEVF